MYIKVLIFLAVFSVSNTQFITHNAPILRTTSPLIANRVAAPIRTSLLHTVRAPVVHSTAARAVAVPLVTRPVVHSAPVRTIARTVHTSRPILAHNVVAPLRSVAHSVAPFRAISHAPIVSHATAPIVSHATAPIVSHATAPIVSHATAPIVSHATAPIVSHATAPIVSHATTPVVSHATSPSVSQLVSPLLSHSSAPIVSHSVTPVTRVQGVAPSTLTTTYAAASDDYDPNPQYHFNYEVADSVTGDFHGRSETRNGDVVHGEYHLLDPDGYQRSVQYTADSVNGFNAVVTRTPSTATIPAVPVQVTSGYRRL